MNLGGFGLLIRDDGCPNVRVVPTPITLHPMTAPESSSIRFSIMEDSHHLLKFTENCIVLLIGQQNKKENVLYFLRYSGVIRNYLEIIPQEKSLYGWRVYLEDSNQYVVECVSNGIWGRDDVEWKIYSPLLERLENLEKFVADLYYVPGFNGSLEAKKEFRSVSEKEVPIRKNGDPV